MTDKEFHLWLGVKIKKLRTAAGYKSAYEFAIKVIDMNPNTYYRHETGHSMTLRSLKRIVQSHNMTLSEFFNDIK